MKKKLRSFFGILMCMLTVISSVGAWTSGTVIAAGNTIYVSDSGNDANAGTSLDTPVKTLKKAASLAGADGTVIVTDTVSVPAGDHIPGTKLTGLNANSIVKLTGWALRFSGPATIENVTLHSSVGWSAVLGQGHKLVLGEGITITDSSEQKTGLSIRGGGDDMEIAGSCEVVIKSGKWSGVTAGTRNKDALGNCHITIYDTATVGSVNMGNTNAEGKNSVLRGSTTVKLIGKTNPVTGKIAPNAQTNNYVDITEFDGALPESWIDTGVKVLADKNSIPEDAKPASEGGVVIGGGETQTQTPEIPVPTTGIPTTVTPGDGVVYVSDNGNDTNSGKSPEAPFKTIGKATSSGSTVVVVDSLTIPSANKIAACNIVGLTSHSKLNVGAWALNLGGKTKIENITIVAKVSYSYILANGNSLTIGENVTVTKDAEVKAVLGIRGGGEGTPVESDTNIVIKSGEWGGVHGGTRNASINANTYITVYEGAKIAALTTGNNGTKEGNVFEGNGIVKLVGNPDIEKLYEKPAICTGEMILDLTEFTGTQDAAWANLGATIVTDKAQLPAYVTEHYAASSGEYDLSGIEKIRFISDSGNDTNDGLTKDKPMKSIKKAIQSMGAGGTVAIVGKYTLKDEYTAGLPSFDLTSTCEDDQLVFSLWALHTNNTEIYNLNIFVTRSYNFILHCGSPLKIGKNVNVSLGNGVSVYPGIRGNENGDVAMTDVTIESGTWATVYTGTKKGNILGNAKVTVTGGKVNSISIGNDSTDGRILGSTNVILKGKPSVTSIGEKGQCDGYTLVDISEFEGVMPTISPTITVKSDSDSEMVPMNKNALFINGYPDGTFLPEKVMTRAEAITVASKVAGLTSVYKAPEATAFTDLKADDWYAANVKYLEAFGALKFWGTTLDASKGITRGEFVKLISGMITEAEGTSPVFSDVTAAHPYYNEIILAAKAGLVTGYPDGTFLPDNTLKRSEIVTILNRLTHRNIVTSNTAKITRFSDTAGHWAAPQIIAASCDPTMDGIIIWYAGDAMSANSPVDKAALDLSTTKAVLEGVDANDANAVANAIEAYAVKRRAEIANTATAVNVTGTKYYVAADGDDAKDGKTPETAWKTLSKVSSVTLAAGDGVFFKRGDIFRGQLKTQKGVTYSAYGEGAKPAIYGSEKNYANIGYWQKTDKENVYVSSDAFDADVGLIVFNHGEAWSDKQIDGKKDFKGVLDADLEIYYNTTDKKVYLYSTSDPNTRWSSIEIAPGRSGINGNGNNVTIDNLTVKYVGGHGIGYSSTTVLRFRTAR